MKEVAKRVLEKSFNLKPGETLLVITDTVKKPIGEALFQAGLEMGAEALLAVMKPRTRSGEEPPKPIAEMWRHIDVFVAPTHYSLTHTQARREACEHGARGATMPGITEEIFMRALDIDYEEVAKLGYKMAEAFKHAKEVRVTSPAGTDIIFSIEGREVDVDTGLYREPGRWGNLPAGEVYVAPVEGTGNGVVAIDGSVAQMGILSEPIKVKVEEGWAVEFQGPNAKELEELLKKASRREAFNFPAEFGIGCNPAAKLSGVVLEDEKAYGTIHFAFGDNSTFGGKTKAGIHIDALVREPTVTVDGKTVIEKGTWKI